MGRRLVIAIDGPAASGKGTLARRLAAELGLPHLDTGALYRAVAAKLLREGADLEDVARATAVARELRPADLGAPDLRDERTGQAASRVSVIPEVREALLAYQRGFAAQPRGAVLDGRDIGTVVCPDATHKIFVTASAEERARRRLRELRERGIDAIYADIVEEIRARDARDRTRAVAPLVPAPDAFVLDTTEMDRDAAFAAAVRYVLGRSATEAGGGETADEGGASGGARR